MFGITDTTFNKKARKLIHSYANELGYIDGFSYLYLFKRGYSSTKLRNAFIARLQEVLEIPSHYT